MVARIDLWGTTIGAVAWDEDAGIARTEFTDEYYRSAWDVAPLMMPKDQRIIHAFPRLPKETFLGLPGLLADALPDRFGSQVLNAWLAREGRSIDDLNPIERLLYQGKRGMGALEFQPARAEVPEASGTLEIEALVEVANAVLEEREGIKVVMKQEDEGAIAQLIQVGTSAGGARAKAVIAINPKTREIRSGQVELPKGFEQWILKFDGVEQGNLGDPKGYGRIEYAYYLMAKDCGIEMMPSELLEENGRSHFMTKRFDRIGGEKLHLQSLCAMAHYDYNNPSAYSYEQAFQVMRSLRLPYTSAVELYKRMAFNVIGQNCDDHTKNIAFLMNREGEWRLAPAYDMIFQYNPNGQWTHRHQMSVNGKRDAISRLDLLKVAKHMNIKKADQIIEEVRDVFTRWSEFADKAGVPKHQSNAIQKLLLTDL